MAVEPIFRDTLDSFKQLQDEALIDHIKWLEKLIKALGINVTEYDNMARSRASYELSVCTLTPMPFYTRESGIRIRIPHFHVMRRKANEDTPPFSYHNDPKLRFATPTTYTQQIILEAITDTTDAQTRYLQKRRIHPFIPKDMATPPE